MVMLSESSSSKGIIFVVFLISLTKLSSVIYLRLVSDASGISHSLDSLDLGENTL